MASIDISSPDTPAYSPAEGADLVSFIQQEWSYMDLEELPDEPNLVFFIKENKLFTITMATNPNKKMAYYEHFLESFEFSD
jgi:hypothetical protein